MEKPKQGECWKNAFDESRSTIINVKHDKELECETVFYVKEGVNRNLKKPLTVFLSTYDKLF